MSLKPMLKEQFGLPTMLQYEFTLMCQIAVAPLLQKSVSPPCLFHPPPPRQTSTEEQRSRPLCIAPVAKTIFDTIPSAIHVTDTP